jgi:hypothetical protein
MTGTSHARMNSEKTNEFEKNKTRTVAMIAAFLLRSRVLARRENKSRPTIHMMGEMMTDKSFDKTKNILDL